MTHVIDHEYIDYLFHGTISIERQQLYLEVPCKLVTDSVVNLAAFGCVRFCFLTFVTRKVRLFEQAHKNA